MSAPAIVNCPSCPPCPKCEPVILPSYKDEEKDTGWFSWLPVSPFWLLVFSIVVVFLWWFLNSRRTFTT